MKSGLRLRRVLSGAAVLFVSIALTAASTVAAPTASAQDASVPVVRVDGRGHGHGVGMSQWGAYTMAGQGASSAQILASFYPGTELAHRTGGVVVVVDQRDHARIRFPGGGEVRSARDGAQQEGFPVKVDPGGVVDIVRVPEGYRVTSGSVSALDSTEPTPFRPAQEDCVVLCSEPEPEPEPEPQPCVVCGGSTTTTTAPPRPSPAPTPTRPSPQPSPQPTPTTAPPTSQAPSAPTSSSPVWAVPANGLVESIDRGRTYRGLFELTGPPGAMRVRNHVDVEDYLKGMAEVPSTWPRAAVEAQAVAARTYALRAMAASGELCDTESCQVYVGIAHEKAGQIKAVNATRGVVVTYGGALAATFYSASGGGFAANVQEGFGADYDVPYLPAHPYPTANPDEWALDIALTDVAGRLGYPGSVTGVRVDQVGPSGRPIQMTIEGDAGDVSVDPQDFRRRLGLRSTLFDIETTSAATPPPPPPPEDPGVVGPETDDSDQFAAVLGTRDVDRFEEALTAPTIDEFVDEASAQGVAATLAFGVAVLLLGAVAMSGTLAGYRRTLDAAAPAGLDRGLWFAPAMRMPDVVAATLERWTNRSR